VGYTGGIDIGTAWSVGSRHASLSKYPRQQAESQELAESGLAAFGSPARETGRSFWIRLRQSQLISSEPEV